MTVSDTTTKERYTASGASATFAYNHPFIDANQLLVTKLPPASTTETTLTYPADFTISGTPDASGWYSSGANIVLTSTPTAGTVVVIDRDTDLTQTAGYGTSTKFPSATHEKALDKIILIVQELKRLINRSVLLPVTSALSSLSLPNPDAGKALVWNATEDGLENSSVDLEGIATSVAGLDAAVLSCDADASAAAASAAAAAASAASLSYASVSEVLTGTSSTKIVAPSTLGSLWIKGLDIASAATLSIPGAGGGYFTVTGTTTITKIDQSVAAQQGRSIKLKFSGGLTLTNNTKILLPGGGDIFTAAGDIAEFVCEDTTASNQIWRCIVYTRASGLPVIRSGIVQIVQTVKTDTFTTSSNTFVDVTGLSVTITPTSTSSKILVTANLSLGSNSAGSGAPQVLLLRGSTGLRLGDVAGSRTQVSSGASVFASNTIAGCDITYLDSPASTSAQTYKIQLRDGIGASSAQYINQSHTDTNSASFGRAASSIIVQEFL